MKNCRSLADVTVDLRPVNVLFGPNGAGKSSLMDALDFVRDCLVRDASEAASIRDQGVGLMWDGAGGGSVVSLELSTAELAYEISPSFKAGRIDPRAGDRLSTRVGESHPAIELLSTIQSIRLLKPIRFGLLVTGKGEAEFLADFFRALRKPGAQGPAATFTVIRKIEQLSPITSEKQLAKMAGKEMQLPTRDEEIGLADRGFLNTDGVAFVLLIDDLEHDRRARIDEVRQRYRTALDTVLATWAHRASVHLLDSHD